jgi:hypothetical protein
MFRLVSGMTGATLLLAAPAAIAQDTAQQHHHHGDTRASGWTFSQDGLVYGLFNHQGGPRGGDEFKVPNWWMGMWSHPTGKSELTLTTMLSLDPATVGERGYRELFQVGEAVDGHPLVDRQHPHDLFMQLAAVWRVPLNQRTGFTIAGAPVGEPALGPVAFMHRPSAAEVPSAPLGHHTFDSTHIAFGVVTAALDRGPWTVEGSVFNGREPDQDRWDFDFGRMDSVSGRVWFKPSANWDLQVSTGHLKDPEAFEPGNIQRTTASAAWMNRRDADFTAVTAAYGVNNTDHGRRHAAFVEGTRRFGLASVFGRIELVQVETELLLDTHADAISSSTRNAVGAFTFGGVRDLRPQGRFEVGLGADVTFYAVPDILQATHGSRPISFQVFVRVRPPAGPMGRMWNMRMSAPMRHTMPLE